MFTGLFTRFSSSSDSDTDDDTMDLELVSLLWRRTGFLVKFAMLSAVRGEVELRVRLSRLISKSSTHGILLLRNKFSLPRDFNAFSQFDVADLVGFNVLVKLSSFGVLFVTVFDFSTLRVAVDIGTTVESDER